MYQGKYAGYFTTQVKEDSMIPDAILSPVFAFRGGRVIPEAKANFGWHIISRPYFLDRVAHVHPADEYLCFLAGGIPDCFSDFDAEIDFYIGKELELYTIKEPTVVYIPKGMLHCPLEFRVIRKPVLFVMILLSPKFVMTDTEGSTTSFDGPGVNGAPKIIDLSKLPAVKRPGEKQGR